MDNISEASKKTGNLLSDLEQEISYAVDESAKTDTCITVKVADVKLALGAVYNLYCEEMDHCLITEGGSDEADVWSTDEDHDWRIKLVPEV